MTSTKKGNIPFNDAMLAGTILGTCHTEWWNQYEMSHKTVPESPKAMLQDLENIEKVFVEKYNEKARANKAQAGTAPKNDGGMPRKQDREGGSKRPAPKRVRSAKYCKWCKAADAPFATHNTVKCCKFAKDSKQKDNSAKPPDSAKKPWEKGGGNSSQMAYLTKKLKKLEKKLKKTKTLAKKHAHDSSGSDSDSD